MKIWVDADACPVVIKEILYRAANRAQLPLTLIANQMLRVPPSPWIRALQVIAKGARVLDPRGGLLDAGNIEERLTLRNFMESLRSGGVDTGGPAAVSAADRQAFGNRLDSLLARLAKA